MLVEAAATPLTARTLGGDELLIRGWREEWAYHHTNLADTLVAGNPQVLADVYGDELEEVTLHATSMELVPAVVLFVLCVE